MGTTEGFPAESIVVLYTEKKTGSMVKHGDTLGLFAAMKLSCNCEKKVGTITEGLTWGQESYPIHE